MVIVKTHKFWMSIFIKEKRIRIRYQIVLLLIMIDFTKRDNRENTIDKDFIKQPP